MPGAHQNAGPASVSEYQDVSSLSSATSIDSAYSSSSSSSGVPAAYTYNIHRFNQQSSHASGTVNARIPGNPFCPQPNARIPFYETKAANAIAVFDAAFGARSQT